MGAAGGDGFFCRAPIRFVSTRTGRWSWVPCRAATVALAMGPLPTLPFVAWPASAPSNSHRSCSASRSSRARSRRGPSTWPNPTWTMSPLPWMGHPPWHSNWPRAPWQRVACPSPCRLAPRPSSTCRLSPCDRLRDRGGVCEGVRLRDRGCIGDGSLTVRRATEPLLAILEFQLNRALRFQVLQHSGL